MKTKTTTTRRAAPSRVVRTNTPNIGALLPSAIRLDVHPNVIIATAERPFRGDEIASLTLFRHVTGTGTMTTGETALLFAAGFKAQDFSVTLRTFDAAGNHTGTKKG
jgi:hypothetical protein